MPHPGMERLRKNGDLMCSACFSSKDRPAQGRGAYLCCCLMLVAILALAAPFAAWADDHKAAGDKPGPDQALQMLQEGNKRFASGKSLLPNLDAPRLKQAGTEDQGAHAYATVLACSDSRVPVERIFDAGVMDLFVVRVPGGVVRTDEAGSIEYGLAHVHTPVLVVLGHTHCGAVSAIANRLQGDDHELERNIPPLIAPIRAAVSRAMEEHPKAEGKELMAYATENNVWQSIEDLFRLSPATRELVKTGKVKVVGAVYDVGTGLVRWLPEENTAKLLEKAEADPESAQEAMVLYGKGVKPSPAEVLETLKQGNDRFVAGESQHPHTDSARLEQAAKEDQGDHAIATVLTCSDSRVPVEYIFDAGVMDLFVVRVAGNVVRTDEAGSIEYGLAHVHTPVLVVLGHTQCGAVTAVTQALQGHGHVLEHNIPPLIGPIKPAVETAMKEYPELAESGKIVPYAIEQNVWTSVKDLFLRSPATRELVKSGKALVTGAIYDVSTGKVSWLPLEKVDAILAEVEADPQRAKNAMAKPDACPAVSGQAPEHTL